MFLTIFVIDCMRQCFLIKFYQILLEKALKMKEKVTDNSGAKITHFNFFYKLSAASFWLNTT